jgi:hypothetical protein
MAIFQKKMQCWKGSHFSFFYLLSRQLLLCHECCDLFWQPNNGLIIILDWNIQITNLRKDVWKAANVLIPTWNKQNLGKRMTLFQQKIFHFIVQLVELCKITANLIEDSAIKGSCFYKIYYLHYFLHHNIQLWMQPVSNKILPEKQTVKSHFTSLWEQKPDTVGKPSMHTLQHWFSSILL